MGAQMDRLMALTKYQVVRMKDMSEKFQLLDDDPQCVNVCFWYIPSRLRDTPNTKAKEIELGKVGYTKTHNKETRLQ
jgi:glutamate decarboxylase